MHQRGTNSRHNNTMVVKMGSTMKPDDVSQHHQKLAVVVEPHEDLSSSSDTTTIDTTTTTATKRTKSERQQPLSGAAPAKEEEVEDAGNNSNTLPDILMVRLQSTDPTEVAFALKALAESMKEDDNKTQDQNETLENAFRMGAHTLVVMAMRKFLHREDVQTFGCLSLQMLAFPKSQRGTVANLAGGVVAIIMALDTYPESLWVQHAGLAALTNIFDQMDSEYSSESSPSLLMEVARHFVFGFDGIDIIVRALKKFPEQRHLQLCCCATLYNLATQDCFRAALQASEAVGQLGVAYERWYADADPTITTCVSNALKLLVMD